MFVFFSSSAYSLSGWAKKQAVDRLAEAESAVETDVALETESEES